MSGLGSAIFRALFKGLINTGSGPRELPDRRSDQKVGFFWADGDLPPLAPGRGWQQAVVGESFYHQNLSDLTGGPTKYGVVVDTGAQLRRSEWEGEATIEVWINGLRVGSIPGDDVDDLLDEMDDAGIGERATVKARITAGYKGAHYCVQLSLARPLKLRRAPRPARPDAG